MKKAKKWMALLLAAVMTMAVLAGCGKQEATDGENSGSGKLKIGVSYYALSGEYNANLKSAMQSYFDEAGLADKVELSVTDAGGDANTQNSQLENMIASGVNAIILIPGDATAQAVMVEEAHAQNIPVIELCTKTEAEDYRTSFVGSDDIVAGRMLMEYLGNLVDGKGDMIIFHGPTGVSAEINRHTGAQQMIKLYLEHFLIHLIRRYSNPIVLSKKLPKADSPKVTKSNSDAEIFGRMVDYLESHLTTHVTIDQICKDNLIGRSQLQKIFKEHCSLGIIEYFSMLKINAAKELIRTNRMNFTQIAEHLGYTSIHYFSRQFKKVSGMTPSEYASSIKAMAEGEFK